MPTTPHSSYRLSNDAKKLLAILARRHGLTNTATLEWIIRDKAREIPDRRVARLTMHRTRT